MKYKIILILILVIIVLFCYLKFRLYREKEEFNPALQDNIRAETDIETDNELFQLRQRANAEIERFREDPVGNSCALVGLNPDTCNNNNYEEGSVESTQFFMTADGETRYDHFFEEGAWDGEDNVTDRLSEIVYEIMFLDSSFGADRQKQVNAHNRRNEAKENARNYVQSIADSGFTDWESGSQNLAQSGLAEVEAQIQSLIPFSTSHSELSVFVGNERETEPEDAVVSVLMGAGQFALIGLQSCYGNPKCIAGFAMVGTIIAATEVITRAFSGSERGAIGKWLDGMDRSEQRIFNYVATFEGYRPSFWAKAASGNWSAFYEMSGTAERVTEKYQQGVALYNQRFAYSPIWFRLMVAGEWLEYTERNESWGSDHHLNSEHSSTWNTDRSNGSHATGSQVMETPTLRVVQIPHHIVNEDALRHSASSFTHGRESYLQDHQIDYEDWNGSKYINHVLALRCMFLSKDADNNYEHYNDFNWRWLNVMKLSWARYHTINTILHLRKSTYNPKIGLTIFHANGTEIGNLEHENNSGRNFTQNEIRQFDILVGGSLVDTLVINHDGLGGQDDWGDRGWPNDGSWDKYIRKVPRLLRSDQSSKTANARNLRINESKIIGIPIGRLNTQIIGLPPRPYELDTNSDILRGTIEDYYTMCRETNSFRIPLDRYNAWKRRYDRVTGFASIPQGQSESRRVETSNVNIIDPVTQESIYFYRDGTGSFRQAEGTDEELNVHINNRMYDTSVDTTLNFNSDGYSAEINRELHENNIEFADNYDFYMIKKREGEEGADDSYEYIDSVFPKSMRHHEWAKFYNNFFKFKRVDSLDTEFKGNNNLDNHTNTAITEMERMKTVSGNSSINKHYQLYKDYGELPITRARGFITNYNYRQIQEDAIIAGGGTVHSNDPRNSSMPIGYITPCGDIFLELQRKTKKYHTYTTNGRIDKEAYIYSIENWRNRNNNHVSGPHKNHLVCEWFLNYRDPFTNNSYINVSDTTLNTGAVDNYIERNSWVNITKQWQTNVIGDPHHKRFNSYLNIISPQNRTQTDISQVLGSNPNTHIPQNTPFVSSSLNTKHPFFGDLSIPIQKTLERINSSFMRGFDINAQIANSLNRNQNVTSPTNELPHINSIGVRDYYNLKHFENDSEQAEFLSQFENEPWDSQGIIPFGVNSHNSNWNTPLEFASYTSLKVCKSYCHFILPEELCGIPEEKTIYHSRQQDYPYHNNKVRLSGGRGYELYEVYNAMKYPKLTCDKIIPNMINGINRWRPGNIKEILIKLKENSVTELSRLNRKCGKGQFFYDTGGHSYNSIYKEWDDWRKVTISNIETYIRPNDDFNPFKAFFGLIENNGSSPRVRFIRNSNNRFVVSTTAVGIYKRDEYEREFTIEEQNELQFHEQISNGWDAMNLDLRSIALFCLMKYRIQSMVAFNEQMKWKKKNVLENDTTYQYYNYNNCQLEYKRNYHPAKLVLYDGEQCDVVKIAIQKGNTNKSHYWQTHLDYLLKKKRLKSDTIVTREKEIGGYDLNDLEEIEDKELLLTWIPDNDIDASIVDGETRKTWGKYVCQDYDYFPIFTENRPVKYIKLPIYYILERNMWSNSSSENSMGMVDTGANADAKYGKREHKSYGYSFVSDFENQCDDPTKRAALGWDGIVRRASIDAGNYMVYKLPDGSEEFVYHYTSRCRPYESGLLSDGRRILPKPKWCLSCHSYGMTRENAGVPTKQEIFLDLGGLNKLKWYTFIPNFNLRSTQRRQPPESPLRGSPYTGNPDDTSARHLHHHDDYVNNFNINRDNKNYSYYLNAHHGAPAHKIIDYRTNRKLSKENQIKEYFDKSFRPNMPSEFYENTRQISYITDSMLSSSTTNSLKILISGKSFEQITSPTESTLETTQ